MYSDYTHAMLLEALASEFVDGVDLKSLQNKGNHNNVTHTLSIWNIREKIKRFQSDPIKIITGKKQEHIFNIGQQVIF